MSPRSLPLRSVLLLAITLCVLSTLTGCGSGIVDRSSFMSLALKGSVHGGQQAVGQSTLQLWIVGKTGNGSAATPLIPSGEYYLGGSPNCTASPRQTCYTNVLSDNDGNFTLTGDYTCVNSTDQVYITARGGNPGLIPGTNNSGIALLTALGNCGNLASTPFIALNEVTTVAAVWALAPFLSPSGNIGASATNTTGIANAFLDAQLLASQTNGFAAVLPSSMTVETAKLYALADVIATCVNSTGTACPALFSAVTPVNGAAPTDTLSAALSVVRNPSNNVAGIFALLGTFVPFATSLKSAPKDWTMSLTISGGGLNAPTALDIDSLGNVWIANYAGSLSGFSPQGVPFTSTGFGIGNLSEVYGLTIDTHNNIWLTNEESPHHDTTAGSLSMFYGVTYGQPTGTLGIYTANDSIDYPVALASDTNGNVLVANFANSSASIYSAAAYSGFSAGGIATGNSAFPVAISADLAHGLWLANNGDSTVTHVDAAGNLFRATCCDGANGIATDANGNAWISNYYSASISEVSSSGTVLINQAKVGGLAYPAGVSIDAAQNVWVANYRGASVTGIAGSAGTFTPGTALSPSTGFGRDAGLVLPFAVVPDASGNLWISNFGANNLVMLFGLATPTATPKMPTPTAP